MGVSLKEVEYAANLARLELAPGEKEAYTEKLSAIFEYMEQLQELDTANIPPTTHVLNMENVFREDSVSPGLSREKALSNAPEQSGGCFKVPRIL